MVRVRPCERIARLLKVDVEISVAFDKIRVLQTVTSKMDHFGMCVCVCWVVWDHCSLFAKARVILMLR